MLDTFVNENKTSDLVRLPATSHVAVPTTQSNHNFDIETSIDRKENIMTWKMVQKGKGKTLAGPRYDGWDENMLSNESSQIKKSSSTSSMIPNAVEIIQSPSAQMINFPHSIEPNNQPLNQLGPYSSSQSYPQSMAPNHSSKAENDDDDEDEDNKELNYLKANFPIKLYRLIINESPHGVQWMNDGQTFMIQDINEFTKDVLPKYFNSK